MRESWYDRVRHLGTHSLSSENDPHTTRTDGLGGDAEGVSGTICDGEAARLWAEFLDDADPRGPAAFDRLYNHFLPVVFRYCRSRLGDAHLAEDVANTVFVRLLEARPVLRSSFVGLLLGTARNVCVTEMAVQRRTRASDSERHDDKAVEPDGEMARRDTHAALADCLDRLSDSDQTLVLLRHGEGLTYAQISDVLGLRVVFSTLTRRLRAIESKLRRCLKEKNIL